MTGACLSPSVAELASFSLNDSLCLKIRRRGEESLRRALDINWPPHVRVHEPVRAHTHTHGGGVCSRRNNSGQKEMLYVQPLTDKSIEI